MENFERYRVRLAEAAGTIERLRGRLREHERTVREPIAIIGMGLRLPNRAQTPEDFWTLLRDGVDATREFPAERGDAAALYDPDPERPGHAYVIRGGFLDAIDGFDPAVFGIAPREAVGMDPQQRIMLEIAWEALERAGYPPTGRITDRTGGRTGVYVGASTTDYVRMRQQLGGPDDVDGYQLMGEPSFIAGRISHTFGFQGPSEVLDTACSSSLVAVHEASQALRKRECDLALAGGVSLMLSPYGFLLTSKFRALSPEGRCKTFDASADGYARGEGAGLLVLKRLSEARSDGDTILAVLRGSAVNHDGRSSGLTVPNPQAQQDVIRRALAQGGVAPAEVGYVEAHGTGTPLGDPIELRALDAVLRPEREVPLLVGSVKTNIGHLESAAGVAGLIKAILVLRHGQVPPHLHLTTPNPKIPWRRLALEVPTSLRSLPETARTAAVSSFGASGTNAHVVLSAPDPEPPVPEAENRREILVLSAHTPAALRRLAHRYADHLRTSEYRLGDICFTSQVGRARLAHGIAVDGTAPDLMADELAGYVRGDGEGRVIEAALAPYRARKIAWLFTGQGAQYAGMAAQLRSDPEFAAAFEECARLIDPLLPVPLAEVVWTADDRSGRLDDTRYTQPALFAIGYALGRTLLARGVLPAALLGHSVGEITAACFAGVLDLPDAARLVTHRGRLMAELPTGGAMVAVTCGEDTAVAALGPYGGRVTVAAVNGPADIVLSGEADAVAEVAARLASDGRRVHPLNVSHAFHSPLLRPMLNDFAAELSSIVFRKPQIPLVSNVTGRMWGEEQREPGYWLAHAEGTVRFHAGLETLHADGLRTFVEIGPQPVLTGLGRRAFGDPECAWVGVLRKGRDDRAQVLRALATLHLRGCAVDWAGLHDAPRRVPGPTYPWERERYWFRPAHRPGSGDHGIAGLGVRVRSADPLFEELLPEGSAPTAGDALAQTVERAIRAATASWGGRWRCLTGAETDPTLVQEAEGPWLLQATVRPDARVTITGSSVEAAQAGAPWRHHGTVHVHRTRSVDPGIHAPASSPGVPDRPLPEADGDEAAMWGTVLRVVAGGHWLQGCDEAFCADVRNARAVRMGDGEAFLLDGAGRAIGVLRGLRFARVPEPDPVRWRPEAQVLHELAWVRAEPRVAARSDGQRVVLVGDDPLTLLVGDALRGHGAGVSQVAGAVESVGDATIIVVSGLGLGLQEITTGLLRDRLLSIEQLVVSLVGELAARGGVAPRIVLLTRGAVDTGQRTHHPAGSTLWGLGRVVALEHPELWGGVFDLDPDSGSDWEAALEAARAILHLDHLGGEDQAAFRAGETLVPRLRPAQAGALPVPRPGRTHRPGTILVTGGLGGIGLAVAQWLAVSGTQRLVLAGRTALPPEDRWDDPAPPAVRAAIAGVRRLRALGTRVETVAMDVTDEEAVAVLLGELAAGSPPLRGVVHAAGVSVPQDLVEVDPGDYHRVWAPKTIGTWLLHRHTRDLDLDLFVCFSSIAATWGSRHLASYAAGNAFLDGLAGYRRALGLPCLTVDWGPWGQDSHLAEGGVMTFLESVGLRRLDPAQCLSLLGRMLRAGVSHKIVCAADWDRYRAIMESRSERPVFADLPAAAAGPARGQAGELLGLLARHDAGTVDGLAARRAALTGYLRTTVSDVLGMTADTVAEGADVFALGLDSLMVMEITSRSGRDLGLTLRTKDFFARSSLTEWAEHLERALRGAAEETTGGRPEEFGADESGADESGVDESGAEEPGPYENVTAIAVRSRLDPAIGPIGRPAVTSPERILLTGATGFVGAFLLDELLESTDAEVVCLVRGADEVRGRLRLRAGVGTYLPWREEAARRVQVLPGDLTLPRFGLDDAGYADLADSVDTVYHAGAQVDFVHTFDQLAAANIGGTQEVLRLAATGRPKLVGHVSTYGIWGLPAPGRTQILEDEDIDTAGRLVTGYAQTKWGAEYLVRQAAGRGLRVRTFRLGRVLGDARTGAGLTTHFTCRVIKGCVQLGLAPDLGDLEIEMTPVDYVARAMVRLSSADVGEDGVYHLVNPRTMPFRRLVEFIQDSGWPVEMVDRQTWWAALRHAYGRTPNELHPVMDIVRDFVVGGEEAIDYDVARAVKGLDGSGIVCPPLDEHLLETYFGYYLRSGYLTEGRTS
jgi:polyketide synthase